MDETVEQQIARLLQRKVDEQGDDVIVTAWFVTWEGQSVQGARDDEWDGGSIHPDGQSPAMTLGLLEQAQRNAIGKR